MIEVHIRSIIKNYNISTSTYEIALEIDGLPIRSILDVDKLASKIENYLNKEIKNG